MCESREAERCGKGWNRKAKWVRRAEKSITQKERWEGRFGSCKNKEPIEGIGGENVQKVEKDDAERGAHLKPVPGFAMPIWLNSSSWRVEKT